MILRGPEGATRGVVMLHGRGGSAADILSLLGHAGLDRVAAIAPEAEGRSWWPSSFLAPSAVMEPFVQSALVAVDEAIAELQARGIAREAIWLCGFSQGACLALEAYARIGDNLAGVIALSGGLVGQGDRGAPTPALYGHADKRLDYPGTRTGPVWLSVHARDPHIPLQRVQDSAQALRAMGAQVEVQVYPGAGHGVMAEDISAMQRHLGG